MLPAAALGICAPQLRR